MEQEMKEAVSAFIRDRGGRFKNDYQVALMACSSDYKALSYASEELRDCKEFVMEVYRENHLPSYLPFGCVSERLRDDEDVVRLYCSGEGSFMKYANKRFWDNEEMVLLSVREEYCDKEWEWISDRLRDDKEFIKKLCAEKGIGWFVNASKRLRDDEEFVIELGAIDYASERIQQDKDVLLALCERNVDIISQVEKYYSDDDDLAEAIMHNAHRIGCWLESLSPRLRDDREYVKRWCEKGTGVIYASDRLKNDLELCRMAIENRASLKSMGEAVKDDYDTVHLAVERNRFNLEYASERLRNDPVIVLTALNGHFPYMENWVGPEYFGFIQPVDLYEYIGDELKRDSDFAKIVCRGFLKTAIGQKYRAEELMEEPLEVYRILEEERDNLIEYISCSPKEIEGIDFTEALKRF